MVNEIEKLIDDKTLDNLKILWEKLEDYKTNHVNNQIKDSIYLTNDLRTLQRYKHDLKLWVPPNFAKLPIQDYGSKISTNFSMAYNEDEKKNYDSSNVILF